MTTLYLGAQGIIDDDGSPDTVMFYTGTDYSVKPHVGSVFVNVRGGDGTEGEEPLSNQQVLDIIAYLSTKVIATVVLVEDE